jgi:hypothetical protein
LKKRLEPIVINKIKTNPDMEPYREHKTTMIFNYSDKNGVLIFKIAVTPGMYE